MNLETSTHNLPQLQPSNQLKQIHANIVSRNKRINHLRERLGFQIQIKQNSYENNALPNLNRQNNSINLHQQNNGINLHQQNNGINLHQKKQISLQKFINLVERSQRQSNHKLSTLNDKKNRMRKYDLSIDYSQPNNTFQQSLTIDPQHYQQNETDLKIKYLNSFLPLMRTKPSKNNQESQKQSIIYHEKPWIVESKKAIDNKFNTIQTQRAFSKMKNDEQQLHELLLKRSCKIENALNKNYRKGKYPSHSATVKEVKQFEDKSVLTMILSPIVLKYGSFESAPP